MANLSISRAWDETRDIVARDGQLMLAVTLALIMVPVAVVGLVDPLALDQAPPEDYSPSALSGLLQFISGALGIVAQAAIVVLALKGATSVGEAVREGFRHFPAIFGTIILLVIVALLLVMPIILGVIGIDTLERIAAGATPAETQLSGTAVLAILALVALAIFLGVRLSMIVPTRVAERVGPIGMIRRSWSLTRGHFWRILGFFLLFAVGVLVFALVYMLLLGLVGALLFDEVDPFTVAALYQGLVAGFLQAMVTVLSSTLIARIYVQIAAAPVVSVPPTAD